MTWNDEYDVVVVGSGIGGMSAALTAAEKGAKVLVLEKFEKIGGVSSLSSGQLWPGPTHVAEDAGIKDNVGDAQNYIDHLSQGFGDPDMRENYYSRSRECIRFVTDTLGIGLQVVKGLPDYYYPSVKGAAAEGRYLEPIPFPATKMLGKEWADKVLVSPFGSGYSYVTSNEFIASQIFNGEHVGVFFQQHITNDERCAGGAMAAAQVYQALKREVTILTNAAATELEVENGRVTGVLADLPSGAQKFRARLGVVLSTGGYDWRKEFVRAFDALPEAGNMTMPTITGDHILMALKVGAVPISSRSPTQSPIFIGYKVPSEIIYGRQADRLLTPGYPHSIIVNSKGLRFANDSFYPNVATKCGRFDGQEEGMPNWPAWFVYDQDFVEKTNLLPGHPGQPLPEGVAMKSDTITGLAKEVGIDAEGLKATVKRWNGFSETGVDEDFARGSVTWGKVMTGDFKLKYPNFAPLNRAPFYATKLERVTMGVPTAGLPINGDGNVLNVTGSPVPGLYATGNSTAWSDWGGGYNSGIAMNRGLLYGYRAGCHMMKG